MGDRDSGRVRASCTSGKTWQPPAAAAQSTRSKPAHRPEAGGRTAPWSSDAKLFRGEGLVASLFHSPLDWASIRKARLRARSWRAELLSVPSYCRSQQIRVLGHDGSGHPAMHI